MAESTSTTDPKTAPETPPAAAPPVTRSELSAAIADAVKGLTAPSPASGSAPAASGSGMPNIAKLVEDALTRREAASKQEARIRAIEDKLAQAPPAARKRPWYSPLGL